MCGLAVYGPLDEEFTVAHLAYRVLPPACALWGVVTLVLCVAVQLRPSLRRVATRRRCSIRAPSLMSAVAEAAVVITARARSFVLAAHS